MNNPPMYPQQPQQPPQTRPGAQSHPANQPAPRVPYEQPRPQWSWGPADSTPYQMGTPADETPAKPSRSKWLGLSLAFIGGLVIGVVLLGAGVKTGIVPVHGSTAGRQAAPTPVPATAVVYVVTGVSADSISTVAPNNHPVFVHVSSGTTYQREGLAAALKDIVVGTRINIRGKSAADGSITADRIAILDPAISGQVKVILPSSMSITVKSQTVVVVLTSATKFVDAKSHQPVSQSSLKVGQTVQVYGTYNASNHLNALIIAV